MDQAELLSCMREAADALGEFRYLLPQHSPEAQGQVDEARQHLDYAITLLRHAPRYDLAAEVGDDLGDEDDDDLPGLRLAW